MKKTNDVTSNDRMRVLVMGMYGSRGGLEASTMNYYRNFNHERIQYDFINPYDEFYFRDEIIELGGRVLDVPSFNKNPIRYIMSVRRIIRDNKYSIVNIAMLSAANPLPVLVAFFSGVKHIIIHSHNTNTNTRLKSILHTVNKPIVNVLSRYHWACSTEAGRWLFYRKVRLVNNAIELERYCFSEQKREKIRKEFNIGNGLVMGNIARAVPEKNHIFLVRLLAYIHEHDKTVRLIIVGTGPRIEELKLYASKLNIGDSVIFAGDRSDASDFYSAMDVFVLPSKFEGLPMVGIEAQAAGLPVITSDRVTGEMALSENVRYLSLDDPLEEWSQAVHSMGRMDASKVATVLTDGHYNIKHEARRLETFYKSLRETRITKGVKGI